MRIHATPSLADLAAIAPPLETSADGIFDRLSLDASLLGTCREEYADVRDALSQRAARDLPYPGNWAVEDETGFLLYALVRTTQPRVMVETGVANGHSTAAILAAMDRNNAGRLISCDIATDVGTLVVDRSRWTLVVGNPSNPMAGLLEALAECAQVDVFFHDADHSYIAQRFEYGIVWPRLPPGGLMVSDDIDLSHAFADHAAENGGDRAVLLDARKAVGVMRKPHRRETGSV